jgi:Tol biopolymer transport system component
MDSSHRTKSYGALGGVLASFSSDGVWLGTTTVHWSDNIWAATVAIDSLDGKSRMYEERFELDSSHSARPPIWAPAGPLRMAYFRFPRHAPEGELVIVALMQGRLSRVVVPHILLGDFRNPSVTPLWSPSGDRFVWFSADRNVYSTDPGTGESRILLELPERFPQWRWAAP